MRQMIWKTILRRVLDFVIRQRLLSLYGAETHQSNHTADYDVTVTMPELSSKDTSKFAAALQQIVIACVAGMDASAISRETAIGLIGLVAGQLGLEVDPDTELDAAKDAGSQSGERDSFAMGNVASIQTDADTS